MNHPLAHVADLFGPYSSTARPLLPGVYLVLGVAALGWGAGIWRWVRIASGLFLGVWAGVMLGAQLHDAQLGLLAAGVLALATAAMFYMMERIAVAVLGGAVAVLAIDVVWPLVHAGQAATSLVEGLAGLGGTLLSGFLHQPAIKAVTAMFGAFLVAQALGFAHNALAVLIVGLAGWVWQMVGGRGGGGARKPARAGKRE